MCSGPCSITDLGDELSSTDIQEIEIHTNQKYWLIRIIVNQIQIHTKK